jgi:hypothetical protein
MIWLLVLALVVVVLLVVRARRGPAVVSPEEEARTALELHAIRRRLDVAWVRHEATSNALRLRRQIDAELAAIDGDIEGPA